MIKLLYTVLLIVSFSIESNAQQCSSGQSTGTLDASCATQYNSKLQSGSVVISERDKITLLPGFTVSPNGNNSFIAEIDETIMLDKPSYTSIDPSTRPINTSLPVGTTSGVLNI